MKSGGSYKWVVLFAAMIIVGMGLGSLFSIAVFLKPVSAHFDWPRGQTAFAHRLRKDHHVVGICHETHDYSRYMAAGWSLPLVTFSGDLELYLSYFKRAHVVITGRLHGALPSLAYGKPVYYYGTRDSRTTLLDDLGVPIHDYSDLDRAVERASAGFNRYVAEQFRTNLDRIVEQIVARHGGSGAHPERASGRPRSEVTAGE
ncbi:MAG: polysaccharide pyruvyl transferase family protein [SAR324 cluster bacterium]|nr:polysaccharide pyruvyl transferase family protein [SAR324 cluster bacterium]